MSYSERPIAVHVTNNKGHPYGIPVFGGSTLEGHGIALEVASPIGEPSFALSVYDRAVPSGNQALVALEVGSYLIYVHTQCDQLISAEIYTVVSFSDGSEASTLHHFVHPSPEKTVANLQLVTLLSEQRWHTPLHDFLQPALEAATKKAMLYGCRVPLFVYPSPTKANVKETASTNKQLVADFCSDLKDLGQDDVVLPVIHETSFSWGWRTHLPYEECSVSQLENYLYTLSAFKRMDSLRTSVKKSMYALVPRSKNCLLPLYFHSDGVQLGGESFFYPYTKEGLAELSFTLTTQEQLFKEKQERISLALNYKRLCFEAKQQKLPSHVSYRQSNGPRLAEAVYVITSKGYLRPPNSVRSTDSLRGAALSFYQESVHDYEQILPGELVLKWRKHSVMSPHDFLIEHQPEEITTAQYAAVQKIEEMLSDLWDACQKASCLHVGQGWALRDPSCIPASRSYPSNPKRGRYYYPKRGREDAHVSVPRISFRSRSLHPLCTPLLSLEAFLH